MKTLWIQAYLGDIADLVPDHLANKDAGTISRQIFFTTASNVLDTMFSNNLNISNTKKRWE